MILSCVVTHDRLPLTKRCIGSLLATQRPEDRLVVVDNASTDGTQDYLRALPKDVAVVLLPENRFPGAATNIGWDTGLRRWSLPLLHRSDNDIEYLPGWQDQVEAAFAENRDLVLLGILNLHEDRRIDATDETGIDEVDAVGGNVVMPRCRFRKGLRWGEEPWGVVHYEDSVMSHNAKRLGRVARLRRTVANNMAFNGALEFPEYYQRTAALRGIRDWQHST